ncbi:MAG: acyl-CoA/acyl-ACP dehydrogenase [Deltaproteobacteria bacterium]|nr:acyl-CoA/acyl-ACP dehydrogenase [Deltaproteobacteria bacterium]
MNIGFNEDQIEISNQAHRFMENECPPEFVRGMYDDEKGYTEDIWSRMADMGWMGMRIPEEYGGIGLGMTDLCILLEEMGRVIMPGPYFSTVALGAELLLEVGNESQKQAFLPGIAEGKLKGTLALLEPDGGPRPGYIQMEAKKNGEEFVLNGAKLFVPDAHAADFMVVAARTAAGDDPQSGVTLFLLDADAPGVSINPLLTMDASRKQAEVVFENVKATKEDVLGEVDQGWDPLSCVLAKAQVGLTAENVGGAQKAMEIAVDYAKIRIAFGQPIGAYQAVKHMCSQMLVEVEGSRSIMYYAAWAQGEEERDQAILAASVAKSHSSEAYRNVTSDCIQVLGAIGFTWEHDAHLYLKRAKSNQVALGDTAYHREQIARLIGC